MRKNLEIMKKIAFLFMAVGALHAGTLSWGAGFYEPKIPSTLLKKRSELNK